MTHMIHRLKVRQPSMVNQKLSMLTQHRAGSPRSTTAMAGGTDRPEGPCQYLWLLHKPFLCMKHSCPGFFASVALRAALEIPNLRLYRRDSVGKRT